MTADAIDKFAQIARDIGRAAREKTFARHLTTGTGASGEMRPTFPQTNSSSMRSPMTTMRLPGSLREDFVEALSFMTGLQAAA